MFAACLPSSARGLGRAPLALVASGVCTERVLSYCVIAPGSQHHIPMDARCRGLAQTKECTHFVTPRQRDAASRMRVRLTATTYAIVTLKPGIPSSRALYVGGSGWQLPESGSRNVVGSVYRKEAWGGKGPF